MGKLPDFLSQRLTTKTNNMQTEKFDLFGKLGEILQPVNPLEHLTGKAIRAHNFTSFSPDKRGKQMVNDYGVELNNDLLELQTGGAIPEALEDYKSRYERYFSSYLNAKSGTFSMMITGGSNFPVRRHEKATNTGQKEFPFDGFFIRYNYEADRIQIMFDRKPEAAVIYECKRNGFKW